MGDVLITSNLVTNRRLSKRTFRRTFLLLPSVRCGGHQQCVEKPLERRMQLFYSLYWRASFGDVQHGTSQRIITWPQDGVGDYLQAPRSLVLSCAFQIAAGPSGNSQTWLGLPQSPALHTVMQMGRVAMYTVVSEGCVSQDTMAIDKGVLGEFLRLQRTFSSIFSESPPPSLWVPKVLGP